MCEQNLIKRYFFGEMARHFSYIPRHDAKELHPPNAAGIPQCLRENIMWFFETHEFWTSQKSSNDLCESQVAKPYRWPYHRHLRAATKSRTPLAHLKTALLLELSWPSIQMPFQRSLPFKCGILWKAVLGPIISSVIVDNDALVFQTRGQLYHGDPPPLRTSKSLVSFK